MNKILIIIPVFVGLFLLTLFILEYTSNETTQKLQESMVIIPKGSYVMDNNLTFEPKEITVVIGVNNTVKWVNQETTPVFLNSINGNFTQIKINPNESEFLIFVEPGVYEYFGHPWMQGKVIVLE